MTAPRTAEIRNIAVVGHKGSGKTALVEAMLTLAQAAPKGAVRDSHGHFLDDTPEERAHGATLETRLEPLHWGNVKVNLLDTPGDASAMVETRQAIGAVDAALVVVHAKDGLQSGTDRVLQWIREARLPAIIVLTNADDERARADEVVTDIRARLNLPLAVMTIGDFGAKVPAIASVIPRQVWFGPDTPTSKPNADLPASLNDRLRRAREQLAEDVAATDDSLTERYLDEGDLPDELLVKGLKAAVRKRAAIPLFTVASTKPQGMQALLQGLVDYAPAPEAKVDAPLEAHVFKTHIDPHSGRASYTRIYAGVLHADDQVVNANSGQREKIGVILEGSDKNSAHQNEAIAGDIVSVTKLKSTHTGETLSDPANVHVHDGLPMPPRLFSRALVTEVRGADEKIAETLEKLCEDDAALSYSLDEATHQLVLAGANAAHLDLALERLKRRSGLDVRLGPPRIAYRETIARAAKNIEGKQKKQTGGHGQFAVCYIDVEPKKRGEGYEFEDAVVGGTVPRQFIGSVEKGILRALKAGPIAGYPVVDVKVRLFDGKSHAVDSSDAAFQTAAYRGMRLALEGGSPVLLEPHMSIEVTVPSGFIGDVMGHLNGIGGRILGQDGADEESVIRATAPLAQLLDYEPRLSAMTQGRGTFMMAFSHYDACSPQTQAKVAAEATPMKAEEE